MKKIKDNITQEQFKILINHLKGDEEIRPHRKDRLIKVFFLLYYVGIRVNETTQFSNKMIIDFLEYQELHIKSHKQKIEKTIYLTDNGLKQMKKIFLQLEYNDNLIITSERGNKNNKMSIPSMINDVNTYLKKVFGKDTRITSHSFRQSLITELGISGINTKIIQEIIGHKSISTTYNYIKPSKSDKLKSLNTVR